MYFNSYLNYELINYKNHHVYEYKVNPEDPEDIILLDSLSQEELDVSQYAIIPNLGTVAAGSLSYVQPDAAKFWKLPAKLTYSPENCFSLKVSGNSMIDFGIYDGDVVILRRQEYANAGDIVIAGDRTTNEATIKRYSIGSDHTVILTPGNKTYPPIPLPADVVFINGVLVGILKTSSA